MQVMARAVLSRPEGRAVAREDISRTKVRVANRKDDAMQKHTRNIGWIALIVMTTLLALEALP